MAKHIPNFSTLSTLIDRLSIENVKLSHFENELEHDSPSQERRGCLRQQIATQNEIIATLKSELTHFLERVFIAREYEILSEERTFS